MADQQRTGLTREEAAEAIVSYRPLILNAARRYLSPRDRDFDDLRQNIHLALIGKKFPKFDAHKSHLSGYLRLCVNQLASSEARKIIRSRMRRGEIALGDFSPRAPSPSPREVDAYRRAAQRLLTTPRRWLTPRQAEVVREALRDPTRPRAEIARELGFSGTVGLNAALRSIRLKLEATSDLTKLN